MAMHYHQQPFYTYGQPQWPEDVKPALTEDDSSILDDKVFDSATPADMTTAGHSDSRRTSVAKLENEYSTASHVWQDRPHGVMPPTRHYSHSSIPMHPSNSQFYHQIQTTNCGPGFMQNQSWALSARSETSTPTPLFSPVQEPFEQQLQYNGGPVTYNISHQDPVSAVSMSPQSSQGGWASTTSSDTTDTGRNLGQRYRGASPMFVVRSDGIRKKNAKFDIPAERNINTIDALIAHAGNEDEKKELKQQKRLLRNRQAALDSRMRKKVTAEKLEADKKTLTNQKGEMEDTIASLENALHQERQQWMLKSQQYEQYMQQLSIERDEAIRTKTLDTSDLRRQNNILKDAVRELEQERNARAFSTSDADAFSNDFNDLGSLGLEDNWDDEFSLINGDDLKMDESESLQRQATPRPTAPSKPPTTPKSDVMVDATYTWETVIMCLLSGAFIISQAGSLSKAAGAPASVAVIAPSMPAVSDEYRVEAGNVLQAVLASNPEGMHEVLPSRLAASADNDLPHAMSDIVRMTPTHSANPLDSLQASLVTPSRQQQVAAAFTLSAASYNHITSDFDDDDEIVEVKPTKLQQLFANMQAERDGLEKMTGLGSKARERSVLLDRVPEKVLRDFREMIARVE